jgi:hypothetical protein
MQSYQAYQLRSPVSISEPHVYSINTSKHAIHLFIVQYFIFFVKLTSRKLREKKWNSVTEKKTRSVHRYFELG